MSADTERHMHFDNIERLRRTPAAATALLAEWGDAAEAGNLHTHAEGLRNLSENLAAVLEEGGAENTQSFIIWHPVEEEFYLLDVDPDAPDIRDITLYVHRDKDANWQTWRTLLGDDNSADHDAAGSRFAYAAGEVELDVQVNVATGETKIVGIAGEKLERPVNA